MADNDSPMIPKARLDEEIAARKKAQAELAAFQEKAGSHDSVVMTLQKNLAKVQEKYQALDAEYGKAKLQFQTEKTLITSGITDDSLIDYVRYNYTQAPKTEEGATPEFGTWLEGFKGKNPVLFPEHKPAEGGTGGDGVDIIPTFKTDKDGKQQPATPPDKTANGVTRPATPPGKKFSPQEIAAMSAEQLKEYKDVLLQKFKPSA